MYNTDNPAGHKIDLYKKDGATFSSVTAEIKPDGILEVSGYDAGPMCQEVYDHGDVESYVQVAPKHKDQLLLALMKAQFGGHEMARGEFCKFLESEGIEYDLDIWP